MNSQIYATFLDLNFAPWLHSISNPRKEEHIFMQDIAPSHASKFSKTHLVNLGFQGGTLMDWPSAFPDLSPIENLWCMVKRTVYDANTQYPNNDSLWYAIQNASKIASSSDISKLTSSVDHRLFRLRGNKGNYVKY